MLMFITRFLTAVVGVPLLFAVLYWGGKPEVLGGWVLFLAVTAVALIGMWEFYSGCSRKAVRVSPLAGYAAAVVFLAAMWFARPEYVAAVVLASLVLVILGSLIPRVVTADISGATAGVSATVTGFVFVTGLLGFLLKMRTVDLAELGRLPSGGFRAECGALALTIATAWLLDTGCYGFGRALGRVKLAPTLSPGKTVEGAVGGVLVAVLVAVLGSFWLGLPVGHGVALGLLIGVVGQLGDLSKSVFKRDMGIKDFGTVIPGHGGVLDRFDSLMFSLPLVYAYFRLFIVWGAGGAGPP